MIEQRDYQQRIISKTLDAVKEGCRHILVESACGSGKTLMAHLIAKKLYEEYGWKTGWTAMRRCLLAQAEAENERMIHFPHIRYFSTFDKTPPTDVDVLIEDEGQHSASATATALYARISPKVHIGLTATPIRTDRMKLCFSKVIKDAGVRGLIDGGWLSPFHQYLVDRRWTPQNVADLYLKEPERWGKSVVYFMTLQECGQCADLLRRGGVACEVVSGSSDQERQISDFKAGHLSVLLNVIVLTEGFDYSDLRTVFIRPGSRSPTIQMAGRVLRKHPGKPHAQIVQNSDTKWPFCRVASAERRFVLDRGGWRDRGKISRMVALAKTNTLLVIPTITVKLPEFLTQRRGRQVWGDQRNDAA